MQRALWQIQLITGIAAFSALCVDVPAIQAQPVPSMRPQFEVASVKSHDASESTSHTSLDRDPGRLTYINVTVRALLRQAYGLKVYPLSRGPDALSTDRYDVIAKIPPGASKEQIMLMLQSMLEERFKLIAHRETKELPIYTLVTAKSGPKFRPVPDDGSAPKIDSEDGHQIRAHHISMDQLAAALQGSIGDKVVNATDLPGSFDLTLDFNVDENQSSDGPTIFEAVQRQLGLKLETGKGPVEVVVIDHVEKPSAN